MDTHDFLGFYWALTWLQPGAPIAHRHPVEELDGACRTSRGLFLRLWPTRRALILGRWRPTGDTPEQRFEDVFAARQIDPLDATGALQERYQCPDEVPEGWQLIRTVGDAL